MSVLYSNPVIHGQPKYSNHVHQKLGSAGKGVQSNSQGESCYHLIGAHFWLVVCTFW